MTKSTRSTDSVKIRFWVSWEVKIDDHIDGLNIDASGAQIRTHQTPTFAFSKSVEHLVSLFLAHLGVKVEARVAQLNDFLRQELDSHRGVTEDYSLGYIQLSK